MFSLTSNLNFSFINFSLLSSHHAPLWKVWVCLHYHPKLPPLQNWTSPNSPPSLHRASGASQATTSLSAIQWTHPSLKHWERSLGRKNTLIKYFAFTEKKKVSKCSCFVLSSKYAYFPFWLEQNYFFPTGFFSRLIILSQIQLCLYSFICKFTFITDFHIEFSKSG